MNQQEIEEVKQPGGRLTQLTNVNEKQSVIELSAHGSQQMKDSGISPAKYSLT